MARTKCLLLPLVITLILASVAVGQEQALERVQNESAGLRQMPPPAESEFWKQLKAHQKNSKVFHAAIRDWVESLLPQSKSALEAELSYLKLRLSADLERVGLMDPSQSGRGFKPGYVTRLELSRPAEDPGKLTVLVGVSIPCGNDDAVYVYDYSQGSPRRVLESHGTREHDESVSAVQFTKRDATGSQLILTLRDAVQCGSSWNLLSYDLYRLPASSESAPRILAGEHGIWFGAYDPYQVRLNPDELLMEIRDRSIDDGIHSRAHILHFNLTHAPVERVDPVALQPQDFVDEWLTRPWSEMESRTSEDTVENLRRWHAYLGEDSFGGEFQLVQNCAEAPNQWQIGVSLNSMAGKELPEPLSVYFLVRDLGEYRYKMNGISFQRQDGCPGESAPGFESPSLFPVRKHGG